MMKHNPFYHFSGTWDGILDGSNDIHPQAIQYKIKDDGSISSRLGTQDSFSLNNEILISSEDILLYSIREDSFPNSKSKILFMALDINSIYSFPIVSASDGVDFFMSPILLRRTNPVTSECIIATENTLDIWEYRRNGSEWTTGVNGLRQQKRILSGYGDIKIEDTEKSSSPNVIRLKLSYEQYSLEEVNAKDDFGASAYLGRKILRKQRCSRTWIREFSRKTTQESQE